MSDSTQRIQSRRLTWILALLIVMIPVAGVCLIEWWTTPPPGSAKHHIELFRYGSAPSILRANRGDRLTLTFSSRDTGHSFLLQEYGFDAKVSPGLDEIEIYDPLNSTRPPVRQKELEFTAGHPGFPGVLASVSRFRCHVYCGIMHGFEQGDLIIRPNLLFAVSAGLLLGIPLAGIFLALFGPLRPLNSGQSIDLFPRFPLLKRLFKLRSLQFWLVLPVLGIFLVTLLAGMIGTKVGGRNAAVMMTWVVWMFIIAVALAPFNARAWCTICPLPVLGEFLQRGALTDVRPLPGKAWGNRFFGLGLKWPRRLRGTWVRQIFFICIGTGAASLAGKPSWTAFILFLLFALPTVMALIWEKRSFCQYLCPITSFLNVYSTLGRVMVRKRDAVVCRNCSDKPCYRGNAEGWACPFNVFVGALKSNSSCGVCTECYKSCTYDNVTLAWRKGPSMEMPASNGDAWQMIVMLALAMAYSLTILSPWPAIRDTVNLLDKANLFRFSLFMIVLWSTSLILLPGLVRLLVHWGARCMEPDSPTRRIAYKILAPSFAPLGLGLWSAFFTTMLMVNFSFVMLAISDPFGWGWDLLGLAGLPWIQLAPAWIPWIQALCVIAGFAYSLRQGYLRWRLLVPDPVHALYAHLPTASLMTLIAGGMLAYYTLF